MKGTPFAASPPPHLAKVGHGLKDVRRNEEEEEEGAPRVGNRERGRKAQNKDD